MLQDVGQWTVFGMGKEVVEKQQLFLRTLYLLDVFVIVVLTLHGFLFTTISDFIKIEDQNTLSKFLSANYFCFKDTVLHVSINQLLVELYIKKVFYMLYISVELKQLRYHNLWLTRDTVNDK